jgi:WD40 repeat protein
MIIFDETERSFVRSAVLRGHASTVLSLRFVPTTAATTPTGHGRVRALVSGGTDGQLLFWDVSELGASTHAPNGPAELPPRDTPSSAAERVPFHALDAHQSGVNCLTIQASRRLSDEPGDAENGGFVLVSGGDDQSLRLLAFTLQRENTSGYTGEQPQLRAHVRLNRLVSLAHASAITCTSAYPPRSGLLGRLRLHVRAYRPGVELVGRGYLFSAGPDQRYARSSSHMKKAN